MAMRDILTHWHISGLTNRNLIWGYA